MPMQFQLFQNYPFLSLAYYGQYSRRISRSMKRKDTRVISPVLLLRGVLTVSNLYAKRYMCDMSIKYIHLANYCKQSMNYYIPLSCP